MGDKKSTWLIYVILMRFTCFNFSFAHDPHCKGGVKLENAHCVRLNQNKVNWTEAKSSCEGMGADLVDITSSPELLNSISPSGNASIWISAHSVKRWLWIGGGEVSDFQWAQGEPNAMDSNEDNMMLLQKQGFLWADRRASSHSEYKQTNKALCEGSCYNDDLQKHVNGCLNVSGDIPSIKVEGSCFRLYPKTNHTDHDADCHVSNHCSNEGMSYYDAERKCEEHQGKLAVLNTPAKTEGIRKFINSTVHQDKRYSGNYWIGAEVNHTLAPKWDTPIETLNKYDGRFVHQNLSTFCGLMSEYRISGTDCSRKLPYVCISDYIKLRPTIPTNTTIVPITTTSAMTTITTVTQVTPTSTKLTTTKPSTNQTITTTPTATTQTITTPTTPPSSTTTTQTTAVPTNTAATTTARTSAPTTSTPTTTTTPSTTAATKTTETQTTRSQTTTSSVTSSATISTTLWGTTIVETVLSSLSSTVIASNTGPNPPTAETTTQTTNETTAPNSFTKPNSTASTAAPLTATSDSPVSRKIVTSTMSATATEIYKTTAIPTNTIINTSSSLASAAEGKKNQQEKGNRLFPYWWVLMALGVSGVLAIIGLLTYKLKSKVFCGRKSTTTVAPSAINSAAEVVDNPVYQSESGSLHSLQKL